jgi:hypothetical protein
MKFLNMFSIVFIAVSISSCSSAKKAKQETAQSSIEVTRTLANAQVDQDLVDSITKNWPEASQKAKDATIAKYGLPHEATHSMLVWHSNGPWKRTIIYREEITHLFPKKHTDVMEQFIDYKVPSNKLEAIWKYDGSVIPERTKGEISARCDKEEMNFLALNLADEIARGKKTTDEARKEYAKSAMAFMAGKTNDYTDNLNFKPGKNTADPDESFMKDMMGQVSSN